MKCIKVIKETGKLKPGYIKRVSDLEAIEKTGTGYWTFVSKKEWKNYLISLKGGEAMYQEADAVISITRTEVKGPATLKLSKNRYKKEK